VSFVPLGIVLRGRLARIAGIGLFAHFVPAVYFETINYDATVREANPLIPKSDVFTSLGFVAGLRLQRDLARLPFRLFVDADYNGISGELGSREYASLRIGFGLKVSYP
jgi:hypothetical protein